MDEIDIRHKDGYRELIRTAGFHYCYQFLFPIFRIDLL